MPRTLTVAALQAAYGADQPVWRQYLHTLGQFLTGHFGYSLQAGVPVREGLATNLPPTLRLAALGLAAAVVWVGAVRWRAAAVPTLFLHSPRSTERRAVAWEIPGWRGVARMAGSHLRARGRRLVLRQGHSSSMERMGPVGRSVVPWWSMFLAKVAWAAVRPMWPLGPGAVSRLVGSIRVGGRRRRCRRVVLTTRRWSVGWVTALGRTWVLCTHVRHR